ncbi:MAG: hypothetical protein QXM68_03915 [Candidatus Aenigmatarchaeota archaeon]|nr:hypothetical protein [Candidatus Aenigmarchaeota archaeon]
MPNYLHDSKFNQFAIDPFATYLIGELYSTITGIENKAIRFSYVLGFSRFFSSLIYYSFLGNEPENRASRLLRDYMLPGLSGAALGGLYGMIIDKDLALPSAIMVFFIELLTDVIGDKFSKKAE